MEKLSENIETGKAPFDQQQALTLEFYESRIGKLEKQIDELKDRIVNNHYDAVKMEITNGNIFWIYFDDVYEWSRCTD